MSGPSLVTGATGFAGSHLLELLLQDEDRVAAWSNPGGAPAPARAGDRIEWSPVDLLDLDAVTAAIDRVKPSVIYHCAGIAHVAESWTQRERALGVNVLGTHHVLEAVRRAGLQCRVLVTGSAMVYRPSLEPIAEDHPTQPRDPYGVSKLAQEMLALRATHAPVLVVRAFNHMGPRQSASYSTSSFAKQVAEIEAGVREPVLLVGNLDARRDLTDVRDTVRAYRLLVARGRPARPYNVCSGHAYRVGDVLEALLMLSRVAIATRVDPARLRPSDNPVILGNPARIAAEVGWSPAIPLETSLSDLLDYWRGQVVRS